MFLAVCSLQILKAMHVSSPLCLLVTFVSSAVVLPAQFLGGQLLTLLDPSNSSALISDSLSLQISPNASTMSVNASTRNDLRTQCNKRFGGSDLDMGSCVQALESISKNSTIETWSTRYSVPRIPFEIPLPYRWFSGTYAISTVKFPHYLMVNFPQRTVFATYKYSYLTPPPSLPLQAPCRSMTPLVRLYASALQAIPIQVDWQST